MKRVILTRGLPASGKTSWALAEMAAHPGQYKRVNKDDLRAMLDGGKWGGANERFVLRARDALILQALEAGAHVIVDDTNLHPKHEARIRELVKGLAEVVIQDFTDVPLDECLARDRKRPNYVGEAVIRRMYRDYLAAKLTAPAYDPALPDAVLCDLDGTLAIMDGRGPYEWLRVEEDALNEPIAGLLRRYEESQVAVILVSGRDSICREHTERWLARHGVVYDALHMRTAGDNRKDAIVKRELYHAHVAGRYNVRFVLDDRDQVVDLWRSLGLTCLQVNYGDF